MKPSAPKVPRVLLLAGTRDIGASSADKELNVSQIRFHAARGIYLGNRATVIYQTYRKRREDKQ